MSLRFAFAAAMAVASAAPAFADDVTVFAAASLQTALDRLAADFETATGHRLRISYGGSNTLARQILEGAPADIFLPAAENWMDEVEKAGLIAEGGRKDLFGNSLVLIAHGKDSPAVTLDPALDLAALLGDGRLSMAMVDAVPAGQYGKAALEALGLWAGVAPRVVQSDTVRAALRFVATGEAPFGIVYATDATAEAAVSVVGTFPADSHPPIVYPGALLKGAEGAAEAEFFEALTSQKADEIFREEGFVVLN